MLPCWTWSDVGVKDGGGCEVEKHNLQVNGYVGLQNYLYDLTLM